MTEPTKILSVAGEGGGLTVYGVLSNDKWKFKVVTSDHTPTLLDEEPIYGESTWVPSLSECMAQIGYAWNYLSPTFVHPDFADEVYKLKCSMDAVRGDYPRVSGRWMEKCGLKPPQ